MYCNCTFSTSRWGGGSLKTFIKVVKLNERLLHINEHYNVYTLNAFITTLETGKHGLPISTYQETQPWRLKEHLGNAPKGPLPSQICSPPPLGRIPFGPLRGRRGLPRSLLAFPSLPCIQGEGGTVRTGKFFVTLSQDAF